jgi:hypothetical protein
MRAFREPRSHFSMSPASTVPVGLLTCDPVTYLSMSLSVRMPIIFVAHDGYDAAPSRAGSCKHHCCSNLTG